MRSSRRVLTRAQLSLGAGRRKVSQEHSDENRAAQIRFRVWLLLVLRDDGPARCRYGESPQGRQYCRPSWFLRGHSSCLRVLRGNGRRSCTINDALEALAFAYSLLVDRSVCRGDRHGAWLRGVLQLRRHRLRCWSRRDDRTVVSGSEKEALSGGS